MNTKQDTSEESCEHEWEMLRDWEGDPEVINGINYFYFFRCYKCRKEVDIFPLTGNLWEPDASIPEPDDDICGQWYDGQ